MMQPHGRTTAPSDVHRAGPSPTPWLRLATWNVLADSNLRANRYLYRRCHPSALPDRLPKVLASILQLNADVVALQEVEGFESFRRTLGAAGYEALFKKRTGESQVDGVALLWRSTRLTMLQCEAIEYAQVLTAGHTGPYAEQMRKHNVGLVGLFQDKSCGREVVVATTYAITLHSRARAFMCALPNDSCKRCRGDTPFYTPQYSPAYAYSARPHPASPGICSGTQSAAL